MSQLDLALGGEVSARHVSFLETGRPRPSREMIVRLSSTLDLPLRGQNAMFRAAGRGEGVPRPAARPPLTAGGGAGHRPDDGPARALSPGGVRPEVRHRPAERGRVAAA